MSVNKLNLGQFIHWDWGQNYPFNACMAKLMECLGGDIALYTYDFFAGISGDDFVMCYGDNQNSTTACLYAPIMNPFLQEYAA